MPTIDSRNFEEPINSFVIDRYLVIVNIIKEDNQNIIVIIIREGIIVKEGTIIVIKEDTVVIEEGINCSLSIFNINIYTKICRANSLRIHILL